MLSMKRTVRMTEAEIYFLQSFREDLQISTGYYHEKFDDRDIVNLIIHYFSKKDSLNKEIIMRKGVRAIKERNNSINNPSARALVDVGAFDFFNEKPESKVMILDEDSEKEIQTLEKTSPYRSLSWVIKSVLFGIISDPLEVAYLMIGYLFSQTFLLLSAQKRTGKYSYEQAKKDYIDSRLPSIDIKEEDLENYNVMFETIKSFQSFDILLNHGQFTEEDVNEIFKLANNGLGKTTSRGNKSTIQAPIRSLDSFASKILTIAIPHIIASKLVSISLIYSSLKNNDSTLPEPSPADNITKIIFFENDGDINSNIEKIKSDFTDIAEVISIWVDTWKNMLNDLKRKSNFST